MSEQFQQQNKQDRACLWLVCLISLVGFLGASIAYPILPVIFMHPEQAGVISTQLSQNWRAILLGVTLATYPLGQFIGAPLLGAMSDKFGRKPILLLSMLGACAGYLVTVISLLSHNLTLLIISRFITGVMEGNIAIARSIATDLETIPKQISLGRINAVSAIGYVIGPLIGGVLSDNHLYHGFNYAIPFYVAMLTTLLSIVLTTWLLKESHQASTTQPFRLKELNIFGRVVELCHNPTIKRLLITSTVFTLGIDIYYEFGPVYLTSKWDMSAAMISVYNLVLSVTLAIGSLLPYYLSKRFNIQTAIKACMLLSALFLVLMVVFATKGSVFVLFGLSGFSITVVNVNLMVLLSDNASKETQGEILGTQLGLRMLGDAIICLLGGFLVASSISAPLLFSAIAAALAFVYYHLRFNNRTVPSIPESQQELRLE
ncbi:MAG: MFS transporter [Coxiellaceae bacterium]|nr:MFS transporter [Coxiellaceae bacterium]